MSLIQSRLQTPGFGLQETWYGTRSLKPEVQSLFAISLGCGDRPALGSRRHIPTEDT